MANEERQQPQEEKLLYNQKWEGYLAIVLASLVNFASVADISVADISNLSLKGDKELAFFGAVSFLLTLLILIFDRVNYLHKRFDFKEVFDGKLEGFFLLFLVIWWISGVGILTRAGGIAYRVLNTYFSAWYALFMSVYTLNEWSSAKDIISIHELTRLSSTLPYWYALLITSLISTGSAIDVLVKLEKNDIVLGKAEYAVVVGAVSAPVALIAILIHYRLICSSVKTGGPMELVVALSLCIWWIVAVSLLTADGAVASSIEGMTTRAFPGNNLYLFLWAGLFSAVQICLKWKAAQAMVKMSDVMKSHKNVDNVEGGGAVRGSIDDDE
mmetsp:Transcript_12681/g.18490  ORF Transcript_12681/g.18490 Transcript_12681/m.18490 type:complete len:328 (+) Transcript_12681:86-1069(+)|eukprot:CAMPEP_0197249758 /NCGR_PEP_ID=MMETSP1429-20130617/49131_1 /TAXON_ID=49237 /ORGANISM="Chaetoceros  sp., Strain UNC1202" /LENGTH=327 /DNA_ID=CAMNT_0042711397 /DNA_START=78 /DNA_END=1061 /DNA_ORIENTATION=-